VANLDLLAAAGQRDDAGAGLASCEPEGVTETAPTKECLFASRVEATWKNS
jgi:hypothetical protein